MVSCHSHRYGQPIVFWSDSTLGHLSRALDRIPTILIASDQMTSHNLEWWVSPRLPITLMPATMDIFLAILADMGNQSSYRYCQILLNISSRHVEPHNRSAVACH